MRILEMFIDEKDDESGFDALSLVENPAIESFPVYLSKQKKVKFAEIDNERQILMGPILIPNKPIYRVDEKTNEEFYIYFSKKTCRKMLSKMMNLGKLNKTTEEHQFSLEGNHIEEAWIKEDMVHDKSALYGLQDPIGTVMVSLKIADKQKYNEYKNKGYAFSLEGFFADKSQLSKVEKPIDLVSELKNIVQKYDKK